MPTPDEILDAFAAAWRAGDAPDAGEWIDRADPAHQDELADLIGGFLLVADDVEPNAARRAELEADPLVARLVAIADTAPPSEQPASQPEPTFGARLRELRERAGLGLAALADRFTESFGLTGAGDRARRYLEELEGGALDPRGVSSRAAFRLEEILGAAAGTLERPASIAFRALPTTGAPQAPAAPADAPAPSDAAPPSDVAPSSDPVPSSDAVPSPDAAPPPGAAPRRRPGDAPEPGPGTLDDVEDEADVADLLRLAAEGLALPADHEWDELDELLRGG